MKIGCCLNMVASSGDPTGIGNIDLIKRIGYDYVELPLAQISELDEVEFQSLADKVSRSGIPCEACNNAVPPYVRLTGPEADAERIKAFFESAINRASVLGAKYVGIGSAGARNVPAGFPREKALAQFAAALRLAADIGAKLGVGINIEPLNKKECNLLNEVGESVEFHEYVSHPNIWLIIDYYHLALDNEPAENIALMGSRLKHAHIAGLEGRKFPSPSDPDGYAEFFSVLKKLGYNDRLSVEACSKNLEKDAEVSLAFLKSMF